MASQRDDVGITVFRHISEQSRKLKSTTVVTGEFSTLLGEIVVACKLIASKVALAGIAEVLGHIDRKNVQGETVAILDQLANKVVVNRLLESGVCSMVVSEENEQALVPPAGHPGHQSKYIVAVDPLDGSSNIACDVPTGTIFGIYRRDDTSRPATTSDLFIPLRQSLVAAGYVLYGPCTMLVYCCGNGVHGFTLDPAIGEFVLTHSEMTFPESATCYSCNESHGLWWDENTRATVDHFKSCDKASGRPYNSRYVGSLVSDFHRNLLYGGIFLYPAEHLDPTKSKGKLRLLYECAPLSFIAENAGGRGSTGLRNVLDETPASIHERIPFYVGNTADVNLCESFLKLGVAKSLSKLA